MQEHRASLPPGWFAACCRNPASSCCQGAETVRREAAAHLEGMPRFDHFVNRYSEHESPAPAGCRHRCSPPAESGHRRDREERGSRLGEVLFYLGVKTTPMESSGELVGCHGAYEVGYLCAHLWHCLFRLDAVCAGRLRRVARVWRDSMARQGAEAGLMPSCRAAFDAPAAWPRRFYTRTP